jgi:hypothetical protein
MKPYAWTLAGALTIVAGIALAQESVWVATISTDGRTLIDIVDTTEAGCLAQVAAYREVVVIEPCQLIEASAITDPNDANKSTRVRPRR